MPSSLSKEYVRTEVRAKNDPTALAVEMAFTTGPEPTAGDWAAASWETVDGKWYARALIGPGARQLTDGMWLVWVRVTGNPELPVIKAGTLKVT